MKISPLFYLLSFYISIYGMRRKRKRMLRWKQFFFLLVGPYGKSWSWREKCLLSKSERQKKHVEKLLRNFLVFFFLGGGRLSMAFLALGEKVDEEKLIRSNLKIFIFSRMHKTRCNAIFLLLHPTKKKSPLQTLKNWKLSERNSWFLF